MSFQWTLIAGFLYFEISVVIIMILPVFSPRRWHLFFKSRLFSFFREHAAIYFYMFMGILCLFLMDAIKDIKKHSHGKDGSYVDFATEMKQHIKLFRAQRNFYICGFAIFLAFVIRRLISMIIIQNELSLKAEKIIKKAETTVNLAKSTVLANTIQANEIENMEEIKKLLKESQEILVKEQKKVKEWEMQANTWKLKYEESMLSREGQGD